MRLPSVGGKGDPRLHAGSGTGIRPAEQERLLLPKSARLAAGRSQTVARRGRRRGLRLAHGIRPIHELPARDTPSGPRDDRRGNAARGAHARRTSRRTGRPGRAPCDEGDAPAPVRDRPCRGATGSSGQPRPRRRARLGPDGVVLDVYTALRPHRSTGAELDAWADRLESEFGARLTATFVRDARETYAERGLLAVENERVGTPAV